jgi:hypothetical protein
LFIPSSGLSSYISEQNYTFNPDGSLAEETVYFFDQTIHYRQVYTYDKSGKYIRFVSFDKDNKLKYRGEYLFNASGKRISYREKKGDFSIKYEETYEFLVDSDHLKIYNTHQLIPFSRDTFRYVEAYENNVITRREMYLNHECKSKDFYKYDLKFNLAEEKEFSPSDSVNYNEKIAYRYDKYNRLIYREYEIPKQGSIYTIEIAYDAFGNRVSEIHSEKGSIIDKRSFVHKYEYDSRNNWIKRETYKLNGERKFTLEREIEYYNIISTTSFSQFRKWSHRKTFPALP